MIGLDRLNPRVRRVAVIGAVVVVVGGGAAVAWAATRPADASYRVATAAPAWVVSSLTETGTIQPVTQATVTFPVSGQVASVTASVGQQVGVGQTLAQLNTTSLNNTVSSDQSAVAAAQAKLATDQTSQTAVSQATQTTSPSSAGSTSGRSSGSSSKLNGLVQSLAGDQNAVRQAQQKVDSDLTLVTASVNTVNAQGQACQDLLATLKSPPTSAAASSGAGSRTSTAPTTAPPATTTGAISYGDCESAIDAALAAETTAAKDEQALTSAVAALSTALNNAVAAVGQQEAASSATSSSHSPTGATSSRPSTSGSSGSSGAGRSGGGGPASADQIAADQASVDAATAQLAAARQNLAAATMVSPIAGTVADVTLTPGTSSGTAHVVIIGAGQDEVMTAVGDNQVGSVKPGENATITPDGATKPINGKVTAVGALASTTSSGTASYPVTISLNPTTQRLFDGATASVSITLSTAQAAVTVPTSAVTIAGRFSVVRKMVNGSPTLTRVTVGVSGATVTQITSGLKAGDQVSLADMTAAMPTATNSFGGAGRIISGGGGGANFRGGGAGAGAGGVKGAGGGGGG